MKLTYFNDNKGRNELTRLIFAVGGIEYEDEEIGPIEYMSRRDVGELPFDQIPTLTIEDEVYGQSCAIARYSAKKSGIYPSDDLQALKSDMIVDSWRDVLDLFYDCAFAREIINGKLSMFPRPSHERVRKFELFVSTTLKEHVKQWNQMLDEENYSNEPYKHAGYCRGKCLCWSDLAVYDVMKTMESALSTSQFENVTAESPKLLKLVESINNIEAIQNHLKKHPYKNISKFFVNEPSLLQRATETLAFPVLKHLLMPMYSLIKRNLFKISQESKAL